MTVVVLFVNDQFARPLAFVSMINALLCGMILICIGIFGKYLEIVYKEVIGRPSFIVRERINVEPESKAERSGHHSGYPTHPTFV